MNQLDLLKKYLRQQHIMQLATVSAGQPWSCTVYYVVDENLRLYWASWPTRRHSKEISKHNEVAAAIPVQFGTDETSIGIQVEGHAEEVISAGQIRPVAELYAARFNRTSEWTDDFTARRTKHRLYVLKPVAFVLFDEVQFPNEPRQEIILED